MTHEQKNRETQLHLAKQEEMKKNILERFQEKMENSTLAKIYDSPLAKEVVGGMRDAYRRVFEQGWFGHDVYDGRFYWDNKERTPADGQFPRQPYPDADKGQGKDQQQQQKQPEREQEHERGFGMER